MTQQRKKKIGVLLVSHGGLCVCFKKAARTIYQDELKGIQTLSICNTADREQVLSKAREKLKDMSSDTREVMVLCDAYGATASRLICENGFDNMDVICVFGLNLPMLLDCINYRDTCTLDELADRICESGKEAVFTKHAKPNGEKG